jgi:hypothetical protein
MWLSEQAETLTKGEEKLALPFRDQGFSDEACSTC